MRASGYAALLLAAALAAQPAAAQGGDRWAAVENEARAILPALTGIDSVFETALSCEARRWTLEIAFSEAIEGTGDEAELRVDGNVFAGATTVEDRTVSISVPKEAIEPMKRGVRMEVALAGVLSSAPGPLVFNLRGSNIAITAVETLCTQRDMSAYRLVEFTSPSAYDTIVRELRADDIKAFSEATASQPDISAAMSVSDSGRRVLFTRLCGSSWYFGMSGCNITGFARDDGDEAGWRPVYDTENVVVHTDPRSGNDGWADLATLPVRTSGVALLWRWDGTAYALAGELPEEPEVVAEEEPAPEAVEVEAIPEAAADEPAPEAAEAEPTPESVEESPAPVAVEAEPTPEPVEESTVPDAVDVEATPEVSGDAPTAESVPEDPAPEAAAEESPAPETGDDNPASELRPGHD